MIRFYLTEEDGDGTRRNALRCCVGDLIGNDYSVYVRDRCYARNIWWAFLVAPQGSHDLCLSSGRCYILSPIMENDQWPACLQVPFSSWPDAIRQEAAANMETNGFSTTWITGQNTFADVFRWLMRRIRFSQVVLEHLDRDLLHALMKVDLDIKVAQIPTNVRDAAKNWMQDRGLAIGWITNQTMIREILHFIIMNLGWGAERLEGEEI
jgi:hypothetical protein